ncbi:PAS domain-containing protein [Hankyongella ginsenosidimutans]|uniref:PAS domain-containing protein n=1 Tax=Hankyongella ginsenosidimutans TaxID=1763828 RepID=A0A4D7C9D9_9SPHN|nr:PAS domain-containing protein [Hankyongella ginsenosidimutans]
MNMTMQFSVANMLNRSKQSSISDHIMAAMEYVQANVMIADADLRIIYMNRTMRDMMERNESAIRTELPNFNARNLIGQTADIFHVRPSHQRDMIERLRTAHSTTIRVGGRIFNLIATPLFDTSGNRIGTVVEWDDKTDRVTAEERLKEIAAENMRVRRALDDCQASVMIADNDYTIVYMNDTMQEMMKANEAALRTELRNFDAARLIGANIDIFHKTQRTSARCSIAEQCVQDADYGRWAGFQPDCLAGSGQGRRAPRHRRRVGRPHRAPCSGSGARRRGRRQRPDQDRAQQMHDQRHARGCHRQDHLRQRGRPCHDAECGARSAEGTAELRGAQTCRRELRYFP